MEKIWAIIFVSCLGYHAGLSQALDFTAIKAEVDFSRTLQEWDGFGFNYVETAHSADMEIFNQEYGGFSLLDDKEKREIIDMVFGEDGLKVGLIKMFLGSLHQTEAGGPFDHKSRSLLPCMVHRATPQSKKCTVEGTWILNIRMPLRIIWWTG